MLYSITKLSEIVFNSLTLHCYFQLEMQKIIEYKHQNGMKFKPKLHWNLTGLTILDS